MMMNVFSQIGAMLCFTCLAQAADGQRPPNVLLLFADDQRADTIAAWGNTEIQTPHLDKLVHRGTSFQCAYMQGSMQPATCVPSRAMLLSGRNLFHVDEELMKHESWPQAFAKAGYRTFMSGKWHNSAASLPHHFQQARSVFAGGMTNPMEAKLQHLTRTRRFEVAQSVLHLLL
jgi:arylsulfatase A-like enzyme